MEEKKEYSVIGTVTIGTDEYRDLLTEKFEAIKRADEEHDRWYKAYCEKNEHEERARKLEAELNQLKAYIKENNEQDKLELWIVRTMRGE